MNLVKIESAGIVLGVCAGGLLFLAFGGSVDAFGFKIALGHAPLQVAAAGLGVALVAIVVWTELQKPGASGAKRVGDEGQPTMPAEGALFALDDPGTKQLAERLKNARQVSMMMRTGLSLFNQYEELFRSLVAQGCRLRIILCDPVSPVASTIYGGNDDSLKSYLQTVRASLLRMKGADRGGSLEVKLIPYAPTFSLMLIEHQQAADDLAQVSFFFTHTKFGRDRPNLILSRSNRWYLTFAAEFDAAWTAAAEWKLEAATP